MALQEPKSMDECIYFTNRTLGNGRATAWVLRQKCPKCGRGLMGKPKDKKGKTLIRAKEYKCPECGYTAGKQEYEETLMVDVRYTCPSCGHQGEAQVPFKRKKIDGVYTLRVKCVECGANIDITKKMKEGKSDNDSI
jgi:predicted RNA-binding Zn-ribbon protein involved in translation (DUF1610 family)